MADATESIRRKLQAEINSGATPPEGQTWTAEQLREEFDVIGFSAPFVVVRRKDSGKVGTLAFKHDPRIYFDWKEE